MDFREMFRAAEQKAGRLTEMLVDIIRIDTSNPPGSGYEAMVDYLAPLLDGAGLESVMVVVPEDRWRKVPLPFEGGSASMSSGKPPLSIYAHMDVVPAGTGWTLDPFEGVVKDGKVFGRGAIDMKGAIPPVVVALELIRELGLEPRFDLRVLFTTDEETGIDPGALYLAENGFFKPPVLHLEGGAQAPVMFAANAGSLGAKIRSFGREAHSGLSSAGINALEEAVPVLDELIALKREVEERESAYPALPLRICPRPVCARPSTST